MVEIRNIKCGCCGKIVTVLCTKDSEIMGAKCPECKFFDLLKNHAKKG